MDTMSLAWTPGEIAPPAPVPRLLVELPSWPQVFFDNLGDLVLPSRLPPLELRSTPAPFGLRVRAAPSPVGKIPPIGRLSRNRIRGADWIHPLLRATTSSRRETRVRPRTVIYYLHSDYLPPLDTRSRPAAQPRKADPEFAPQPIISVPRETVRSTLRPSSRCPESG